MSSTAFLCALSAIIGGAIGIKFAFQIMCFVFKHKPAVHRESVKWSRRVIVLVKRLSISLGITTTVRKIKINRIRCITATGVNLHIGVDMIPAISEQLHLLIPPANEIGGKPDNMIAVVDFEWMQKAWIVVLDDINDITRIQHLNRDDQPPRTPEFRIPRLHSIVIRYDKTECFDITCDFNDMMGPLRRIYASIGLNTKLSSIWIAAYMLHIGKSTVVCPGSREFVFTRKLGGQRQHLCVDKESGKAYGEIQRCFD